MNDALVRALAPLYQRWEKADSKTIARENGIVFNIALSLLKEAWEREDPHMSPQVECIACGWDGPRSNCVYLRGPCRTGPVEESGGVGPLCPECNEVCEPSPAQPSPEPSA
jgi:hypothetical protein